jgi:hypothetical protein
VYDPVLGRFLSADPIIQAPGLSQSHNRYSYCINNPLSLTDPTGYSWLGNLFKKVGNWFRDAGRALSKAATAVGKWFKENWREVVVIVAVVVVSVATYGTMTGWATTWGAGSWTAATVAGAAGGFVGGALSVALSGGSATDILLGGLRGAVIGGVSAWATAGIAHGAGGSDGLFSSWGGAGGGEFAELVATKIAESMVGGAASLASGGDFWSGAVGALGATAMAGIMQNYRIEGAWATAVGTAGAAVIGGTASALSGGSFANGALSGAFVYIFNDAANAVVKYRDRWQNEFSFSVDRNDSTGNTLVLSKDEWKRVLELTAKGVDSENLGAMSLQTYIDRMGKLDTVFFNAYYSGGKDGRIFKYVYILPLKRRYKLEAVNYIGVGMGFRARGYDAQTAYYIAHGHNIRNYWHPALREESLFNEVGRQYYGIYLHQRRVGGVGAGR